MARGKKMLNMRRPAHRGAKHEFRRTAKSHPMNRVVSFISGHGLFRGGVQA